MRTKQTIILWMMLLIVWQLHAATFPTTSQGDNVTWYYVQFLNGQNVLAAQGDGNKVKTAAIPPFSDDQLWKVEGNETNGYTLTSKTGLKLYSNSTAKNGMFYASTNPSSNTLLKIVPTTNTAYKNGFEIQPFSNAACSMNQFNGAGPDRELGLWDKGDGNNPLVFTDADIFSYSIIPYPASLTKTANGKYAVSDLQSITYPNDEVKSIVENFASQLKNTSGVDLTVEASGVSRKTKSIHLSLDNTLGKEAYKFTVDEDGVSIVAAERAGFFYAIQTLKQLLPHDFFGQKLNASADWGVPYLSIEDEPALGYRGFMLDIGRYFYDKEEVKRILDIMAFYKMNRFHWHLTEDQGWRVQIPEYPLLTEIGSIRNGSLIHAGGSPKFFDDTEYGRGLWYTLDDLREVVAYAKELNIDIMPEIDLPGHMVAAITAYPEFSCDPSKKYSVRIDSGISHDVLNVGNDDVIVFLKCLLGHLAEIFPYEYIHIGGDECPTGQWENNADCLKRVKDEGLSGVNELQSWLVEELGIYLKQEYGKNIVVWDELLSHWSSDNQVQPVIMAWNSIGKSADAAAKGFKSIITPHQSLYIDMMQIPADKAEIDEIYQGGWADHYVVSLPGVYNVNPVSSLIGKEEYCFGVQGSMWTETCSSVTQLEYQILPRLLAVAEIGWLPAEKKNWVSFYSRLQNHDEIFDHMGFVYAKHYIEQPVLAPAEVAVKEAEEILEVSVPGAVGYASTEMHTALRQAMETLKSDMSNAEDLSALEAKLTEFKNAPIVQPVEGKVYQIVSASTYYKKRFVGSTVYEKKGNLYFHYTPQTEPEELWQFVSKGSGYILKSYNTGKKVNLPTYNNTATLNDNTATTLRIDRTTLPAGKYDYVPGSVTISDVDTYTETDAAKRFYGSSSGQVIAFDDATLCYPGTWKLVEISDFKKQLEGLCKKCEFIIETSVPGEMNEPSVEAIGFLKNSLVAPAKDLLAAGIVSENKYQEFVSLYNQFMAMPRVTYLDNISEEYYYHIRNAYFTDYYAKNDVSTNNIIPKSLVTNDNTFYWRFAKNNDGTAYIYNRHTNTPVYIALNASDETVKTGMPHKWSLKQVVTNLGETGIAIIDESDAFSWYTNPGAFSTIITKPYDWGAAIWTFEKLENDPVGIEIIEQDKKKDEKYYDLLGRPVKELIPGNIYVTGSGKKIVK